MDQERRELERQVNSGSKEALIKLQRLNDRAGPSPADVEYLQKYLEICEGVLGPSRNYRSVKEDTRRQISLAEGLKELKALNERLGPQIGASVLKDRLIIRSSLFYPDTGQYSYRLCEKGKEKAKADGVDVDNEDNSDGLEAYSCNWNENCEVCEEVLVDGWVPSNVC